MFRKNRIKFELMHIFLFYTIALLESDWSEGVH